MDNDITELGQMETNEDVQIRSWRICPGIVLDNVDFVLGVLSD
ncbi:hypothetical protein FACS189440_08600 [Bacteroidia bacterium]|nr:hypothetical protein FACS189423_10490 [Bacteroidia bacterium]GHT47605.1 hypothetical protein FACS189440_08600 [Bacteroidia bacterium]